jgi:hypothetical protein
MVALVAAVVVMPRALADAPAGRFVVEGDAVRDTRTGLIWQRSVSGLLASQELAKAACTGGFRLPHIKELATLIDESATTAPFIDQSVFPSSPAMPLWSDTMSPFVATDYRCYVMNPDGTTTLVYYNGQLFSGGVARCVK